MPTFGDYETFGELQPARVEHRYVVTVWRTRKIGASDGRSYVVKNYAPRREPKRAEAGDALAGDDGLKFVEGVKDLAKAHKEGGRCLAKRNVPPTGQVARPPLAS